ncbi:cadmium/peroxide/UV radiation responsive anti-sigma factor ChrR [Brevundimonas sp.]|jgi:putative transcriptional regulator|uniref:cadmium/peroxide/UV radiation responsive anti-sigma factor ChrR n=1 Tax=Brevundimonas sp. TaxID=1871086 RepID=UPI003F703123
MTGRPSPSEERLLAYAAGTLSAPEAVVVSACLAMRPDVEGWVHRLQGVGGVVLNDLDPTPLKEDALARALARVDADTGEVVVEPPLNDMPELPEPLRRYPLGRWRHMPGGVSVREVLAPRDGATRVILLKIAPGQATPKHTHGGVELTCVISGAYATENQAYFPGDFEEADQDVLHQPRVISDEPCLCVAALDGQIVLDGWFGRLIQPFVRL